MKSQKPILIIFLILNCGFLSTLLLSNENNCSSCNLIDLDWRNPKHNLSSSYMPQSDVLDEMFQNLLTDYSANGYFSEHYQPSLQAVYYAIYCADMRGKLYELDNTGLVNLILSAYDGSRGYFMDEYAYRWLYCNESDEEYLGLSSSHCVIFGARDYDITRRCIRCLSQRNHVSHFAYVFLPCDTSYFMDENE